MSKEQKRHFLTVKDDMQIEPALVSDAGYIHILITFIPIILHNSSRSSMISAFTTGLCPVQIVHSLSL